MTDETPEAEHQPEPPADADESVAKDATAETTDADEPVAEEATAETADADESVAKEATAETADADESVAEEAPAETADADEPVAEEASAETAESDSVDQTDELQLDIGSGVEEDDAGPRQAALIRGRVDEHGVAMGTGRRKTAVARVRISDGDGKLTVNGREFTDYFPLERDQQMIKSPLQATDSLGNVDVWVRVKGGGPTGQTGAVVLGIARALQVKDPDLHEKLSEGGYLTRDGRMVERKKYGLRKARRSFQFSKR